MFLTNLDSFLEFLRIYSNNITEINTEKNIALTYLNLGQNDLKSIDVSKNINLATLDLGENLNLKELDLTKNTELNFIYCNKLGISELDISKCKKLSYLRCNDDNGNIKIIYVWEGFDESNFPHFNKSTTTKYIIKEE